MLCRQCGRDNPPDARFCAMCGALVLARCPHCQQLLPGDLDLRRTPCPSCGSSLVPAPLVPVVERQSPHAGPAEVDRRLVTVLFADLAGWTRVAAGMDPEDLHAVQQAFFAAVTPPIVAHGGSVEKYIGDAVMAVFGVP